VPALTADGATITGAQTLVAIDNKYEGPEVVYRDGFYYLFLSATNCCNGALTGYSVFVGRSTSPLGPFVDQQGNLLTDAQAGGTPFLTMNGNRWVGTGHNTVFQDEAGQWWTIYHAVDQEDPFYDFAEGDDAEVVLRMRSFNPPVDQIVRLEATARPVLDLCRGELSVAEIRAAREGSVPPCPPGRPVTELVWSLWQQGVLVLDPPAAA